MTDPWFYGSWGIAQARPSRRTNADSGEGRSQGGGWGGGSASCCSSDFGTAFGLSLSSTLPAASMMCVHTGNGVKACGGGGGGDVVPASPQAPEIPRPVYPFLVIFPGHTHTPPGEPEGARFFGGQTATVLVSRRQLLTSSGARGLDSSRGAPVLA